VPRQRLLDLLDAATESPITVVVAPAGAGKTSLLGAWCRHRADVRTAWRSLDEADRSTGQFWAATCAVLRDVLVGYLDDPDGDESPEQTQQGLRTMLAAVEDGHPDHAVMVIDNYQPLDGEGSVATSLEQLLNALPDWLHVVVCSRRMPHLPIDRLRARGQLTDIRFDELQFNEAESLEVVTRLAPWLPSSEAALAAERANGWAAGLRLGGLAARAAHAQGCDSRAADRTDVMVTDYVWNEVLAQEAPGLVQVLLDVSVAERLSPALATTLAQQDDAHSLMLEAEARGLFVERLGSGELQIHSLVRQVLLVEATRRDPVRVRENHVRAARWFGEREGIADIALALGHWLDAGEPRSALRLLATHVTQLYDLGFEEMISATLATIPAFVAHVGIEAQIDLAWCQLLVNRSTFLEVVREAAATVGSADHTPTTRGRVRMLQAIGETMTGAWGEGGEQALEAIQLLGAASWADPLGRFGWNIVARDLALSESWDDGAPSLLDARAALSRDPERRLSYEGISALGHALAGRPLDALRGVAGVSGYAHVRSMTILRWELALAEAVAHRELGDRERAKAELTAILEADVGPVTHATSLSLLELVEICLDNADVDGARKLFGQAEVFVRGEFAGPDGVSWLARRGVLVSLAAGDLASAAQWNERVEDKFWQGVGRARLHLHRGESSEALEELSMVSPRSPRHEVTKGLLLAQALRPGPESLELYESIVPLAVGTGMMQTVASEGPEILDVLERHPWLAPDPWLARVHRAVPPSRRTGVTQIALPGERLTDRELGVLRMLPSRLTIREIGDELGISVNTVKFHLRVVYRKLGVGSRNEAAAMARSLRRSHDARG
jgi:LuxR family maltose regulon positive regulatory protein